MPSKRTPIVRRHRRPVVPEAARRFARLCQLAPRRWDCIESISCLSQNKTEFCPECAEHRELTVELLTHFGVPPWRSHMFHDDFAAPAGLSGRKLSAWWAGALQRALDEANAPRELA
jgi:hypothetical protein